MKYKGVGWNRQKKIYDAVLLSAVAVLLCAFAGATLLTIPNATIETLLIRASAWAAIVLLHVILCIGPMARRFARFARAVLHWSGELVDTKCYFGVMRPATGKVHRACAVRCLDGGVPPGLLLRTGDGADRVVLLAGEEGRAPVFDPQWAALTVVAEGDLEIHDGVPVLRAAALCPVTGAGAATPGAQ